MELTPLTKDLAERIAAFFKSLENKHTFQYPGIPDTLMVGNITIAPFKGPTLDAFKYNLQTGITINNLLERYPGPDYTVLVIANILSVDNITLTQPYFFELGELSEKQIKGFILPGQFS